MSSDKALPWFPYYIADWTHATAHLNALERGVYIALVEVYWTRGSLVNDNARLAAIARATPTEWAAAAPAVLGMFKHGKGNALLHPGLDRLKHEQTEKYRQKREASAKGVEARRKRARANGHAAESTASYSDDDF